MHLLARGVLHRADTETFTGIPDMGKTKDASSAFGSIKSPKTLGQSVFFTASSMIGIYAVFLATTATPGSETSKYRTPTETTNIISVDQPMANPSKAAITTEFKTFGPEFFELTAFGDHQHSSH